MTFNQLAAYFQGYAAIHPALQDSPTNKAFVGVHTDKSADDFIRTCKSPVILVLVTPDKKLLPPLAENYNWEKMVCFFILRKCARKTEADVVTAQNDCEVIANDFVTRIIEDRHTLITGVQQETITVQPVGPMTDDFYGQAVMFNLIDAFAWEVDSTHWL
jgi:hypothetical protein